MNSRARPLLLDVQGVHRVFDDVIVALSEVSLAVERGERVALLGPSGSGKSTLLSLIARYNCPNQGRILIDGRALEDYPQATLRTRWIGMLFQQFHLFDTLSPLENIELALIPTTPRIQRRCRSRELIECVGLESRANVRVRDLSAGERQRIAFCRSISNRPALLLADEPTGNLDSDSKRAILGLMQSDRISSHGGMLVATHDPAVADVCHRAVHLKDGRVVR